MRKDRYDRTGESGFFVVLSAPSRVPRSSLEHRPAGWVWTYTFRSMEIRCSSFFSADVAMTSASATLSDPSTQIVIFATK